MAFFQLNKIGTPFHFLPWTVDAFHVENLIKLNKELVDYLFIILNVIWIQYLSLSNNTTFP